jgi:hypothetical protein
MRNTYLSKLASAHALVLDQYVAMLAVGLPHDKVFKSIDLAPRAGVLHAGGVGLGFGGLVRIVDEDNEVDGLGLGVERGLDHLVWRDQVKGGAWGLLSLNIADVDVDEDI